MGSEFYERHRRFLSAIDGFFLKNPVLEKGVIVAPVVVASVSLKNAVVLSIAFSILTFFTVLIASFFPSRMPHTLRVIFAVAISGGLYIPVAMLIDLWFPDAAYQLGIFLPLMITNPLIIWRSESRFFQEKKGFMILDLLLHILGFWAVICLVGAARELWGSGTLWGHYMSFVSDPVTGILLPFSGFILIGFLAAALQRCRNALLQAGPEKLSPMRTGMDPFGYQTVKLYQRAKPSDEEVLSDE